jgi:hypothetical protein
MSGNTPLPVSLGPVAPSTAILPHDVNEARAVLFFIDKLKELEVLKRTYHTDTQAKDAQIAELELRIADLLGKLETANIALSQKTTLLQEADLQIDNLRGSLQELGQRILDQSGPNGSTEVGEEAIPLDFVRNADISGPTGETAEAAAREIPLEELEIEADHSGPTEISEPMGDHHFRVEAPHERLPDVRLPGMVPRTGTV